MPSRAYIAALSLAVLIGCGDSNGSRRAWAYRLVQGSNIAFTVPPEVPNAANEEVLNGTLTVVPAEFQSPNTFFALTITEIDFRSDSYTVTGITGSNGCNGEEGGVGCIQGTTLEPDEVDIVAIVSINGEQARIQGTGPRPDPPADFRTIKACGLSLAASVTCEAIESGEAGGYTVTIVASSEGGNS